MTKYSRVTAKVFGETASTSNTPKEIGQFGSAKAGTYNATGDVATIQNLSAWSNGWIDAVTPTQQFPSLPEMTGVHKVLSYQEAYLLQQGLPEWDSATIYYINNFCSKNGKIYISQTDENLNNDPESDTVNWQEFASGGSSRNIGEIVTSTIPLTDAGLHLLDGALIQGGGIYNDFVDYVANLYNDDPTANYFAQDTTIYDYVKIGNLTNNNGILSGFSDSAYGQMPQAFPTLTSCKVVFKVKLSDFTRHQVLLSRASDYNKSLMLVRQNTAKFCCYDGSWIDGTTTLSANVDYWFGVSYNGTAFTGYLLQDNNYTKDTLPDFSQWSQEWTTTTTNFIDNNLFNIGYNALSSGEYWSGSVDLNNCYIEVNGSLWWEGSSILTPEQSWQQSVTDYGVCGKFVYDSVNNTVRLPKYNSKIYTGDGTAPVIGTGTMGLKNCSTSSDTNPYELLAHNQSNGQWLLADYNGNYPAQSQKIGLTSDSTKSGIIANLANITTSLDGYYYIVIATSTKTEIEVDIDEIATDLNGKADVDLTNVNNSGTSKVAGWAMPSNTYIDLTLGASGSTYIAPANGWFTLVGYNGNAGSTTLLNETSSVITMTGSPTSAYYAELSVPCAKNDVIQLSWHNGNLFIPAEGWFKFVYAKGSESEAQ